MEDKDLVKHELDEFKEEAKKYTLDDLRSGNWFLQLMSFALKNYAQKVDAARRTFL